MYLGIDTGKPKQVRLERRPPDRFGEPRRPYRAHILFPICVNLSYTARRNRQ
jgi:hypothetical protein